MKISGNVWKYGNNINTDYIIPGRYMELTDPYEMAKHAMEGIDQDFINKVKKNDIIVAGENFGCGSSREHAPLALKYAGIGCVIAESYARIFYRNAINIGFLALECPEITKIVQTNDIIEVDLTEGLINNKSNGKKVNFIPPPPFMLDVLNAGGIVSYLRKVDDW
ncbi:3-isopropylmalate dehydratase small subunit [Candidatus Bathyarchaeota archaeon]|nr:3-isopropylmalate dehydratase small subunit [Candidatus Bathyarchaeota archaeon]